MTVHYLFRCFVLHVHIEVARDKEMQSHHKHAPRCLTHVSGVQHLRALYLSVDILYLVLLIEGGVAEAIGLSRLHSVFRTISLEVGAVEAPDILSWASCHEKVLYVVQEHGGFIRVLPIVLKFKFQVIFLQGFMHSIKIWR